MRNLLFILSLLMMVTWATAYFVYNAGPFIHALPLVALICSSLAAIYGVGAYYKSKALNITDKSN